MHKILIFIKNVIHFLIVKLKENHPAYDKIIHDVKGFSLSSIIKPNIGCIPIDVKNKY